MRPLPPFSCLLVATLATAVWAQNPAPTPASAGSRITAAKRTDKPAKPGKVVFPDPDLLDGAAHEPEKRPLHGMLSEIEMGEKEGGNTAKVSPDSGPAGQAGAPPSAVAAGGANQAGNPSSGAQAAGIKEAEGPPAAAEGIQVADLKIPEGAQAGGEAGGNTPADMKIGDATLQIQTLGKNAANVIGTESSTAQQYEKKVPGGGQYTDNRNRGVEKGRTVPKGL